MTVLVIAEHDNTQLDPSTLHAVAAASQCANDVHVLVAGCHAAAVASAAASIAGVSKVLHADGETHANTLPENAAAQVLAIVAAQAGAYSHILFAATANGKNIAPRVAAKLDVAQISDISKMIKSFIICCKSRTDTNYITGICLDVRKKLGGHQCVFYMRQL